MHERLMLAIEDGDIKVLDLREEGERDQDVRLNKRPACKVLRELLSDDRTPALRLQSVQEPTRFQRCSL